MTETILSFSIDIGDVLDVDIRPDGSLISIDGFGRRQVISIGERHIELPSAWPTPELPHLRCMGLEQILLIDTSSDQVNGENAFVIDMTGQIVSRFHLGAGVIDACYLPGSGANVAIAAAFHVDAAHEFDLEVGATAQAGVLVVDTTGRPIANLNSDLRQEGWSAQNIQCLVARESGELVLIPDVLQGPREELHSPLVFYDWRSGRIRIEESEVSWPLAISSKGSTLFMYSPEESEDALLACDLHGQMRKNHGFYKHVYRGLPGGRFLAQLSGTEYNLLTTEGEPSAAHKQPLVRLARHP